MSGFTRTLNPMLLLTVIGMLAWYPVKAQQSLIDKGQTARAAGDLDVAERHFRTALNAQPDNPDPALFLSIVLTAQGRPDAALQVLSPFAERFPDYIGLHLARVRALAASGDVAGAERVNETILQRAPDNAAALASRARLHLRRGNADPAERLYRRVLAENPAHRAALVGHVDAALLRRKPDLAAERLDALITAHPGDPAIAPRRERLADLRAATGEWLLFTQYQLGSIDGSAGVRHRGVIDLTRETPGMVLRGRLHEERRLGDHDHLVTGYIVPWRDLSATPTFRASMGPGNRFLAQYRLGVGINTSLRTTDGPLPSTNLLADVQQSIFDVGLIQRYGFGARQYVRMNNGSLFLTGWTYLTVDENDNNIFGWVLSANRRLSNGVGLVAGYGVAPEDAEGRTIVIRTAFAGVRFPLSEDVRLFVDMAHENVVDIDRRANVAVGLSFRF